MRQRHSKTAGGVFLRRLLSRYTKGGGSIPVMSIVSKGIQTFRFSRREPKNIWDDERWGEELGYRFSEDYEAVFEELEIIEGGKQL